MKDKSSCKDCLEKHKPDAELPGDLPACDTKDAYSLTEHSDREKKTWCSYMENGFRESRDIMDKQGTPDQTQKGK